MDNRPPSAAVDPMLGRVLDGRYRIEARVARGGMATVYRATDLRLQRAVAVKVMHPVFAEDPGFAGRFVREARSAARLSHPHVVAVHDQGESEGLAYLVMEYVRGRTLRDVLRQHGALTPAQAMVLLEPILEALAAAHAAGIVHRDIKPENVIISDEGRVKVADFGLARVVAGEADAPTMTRGLLIGTVAYLAPEQVESGAADVRSDVYAAGVLLHELLTGRAPFSGESPLAVAYQHVNSEVPAPSASVGGIPPVVDALVLRATRRRPDARYAGAAEFLADVRRARAMLPSPTPLSAPRSQPDDAETTVIATGTQVLPVQPAAPAHDEGEVGDTRQGDGDGPTRRARSARSAPRRRRGAVLAVLLVGALAVGTWQGWAWWQASRDFPLPDVRSLSVQGATATLEGSGLLVDGQRDEFSETVPAGRIIDTVPVPGAKVGRDDPVVLVVSKGKERYEVPDLVGALASEADNLLDAVTMTVGDVVEQYDERVQKGRIVRTSPAAGESVKRGTAVDLVVSRGPAPVTVPTVEGRGISKARELLKAAGLAATVTEQYSESVARGIVISQSPAPGMSVRRGSTVDVVVSLGPPLVTVPDVRGKNEKQARTTLEALGFTVKVTYPLGQTPVKRVAIQSPKAGSSVPKGSTVTLQVV